MLPAILSLSAFAAEVSPSQAVAESESVYADLNDAYGVLSTIDAGVFASYQGRDRAAWLRVYQENREKLVEKLSKIPVRRLSPGDARAVELMHRHLNALPEQFKDEMLLPGECKDAQRKDLALEPLRGALYNCFIELGNNLQFEEKRVTRISAFGMLGEMREEERRKKLFYAFVPLWQSVNGKDEIDSPYRRLIPLATSSVEHGSEIDSAARTVGVSRAKSSDGSSRSSTRGGRRTAANQSSPGITTTAQEKPTDG